MIMLIETSRLTKTHYDRHTFRWRCVLRKCRRILKFSSQYTILANDTAVVIPYETSIATLHTDADKNPYKIWLQTMRFGIASFVKQ